MSGNKKPNKRGPKRKSMNDVETPSVPKKSTKSSKSETPSKKVPAKEITAKASSKAASKTSNTPKASAANGSGSKGNNETNKKTKAPGKSRSTTGGRSCTKVGCKNPDLVCFAKGHVKYVIFQYTLFLVSTQFYSEYD